MLSKITFVSVITITVPSEKSQVREAIGTFTHFPEKMSAKHTSLNNHSLSVVFLGRSGVT